MASKKIGTIAATLGISAVALVFGTGIVYSSHPELIAPNREAREFYEDVAFAAENCPSMRSTLEIAISDHKLTYAEAAVLREKADAAVAESLYQRREFNIQKAQYNLVGKPIAIVPSSCSMFGHRLFSRERPSR